MSERFVMKKVYYVKFLANTLNVDFLACIIFAEFTSLSQEEYQAWNGESFWRTRQEYYQNDIFSEVRFLLQPLPAVHFASCPKANFTNPELNFNKTSF